MAAGEPHASVVVAGAACACRPGALSRGSVGVLAVVAPDVATPTAVTAAAAVTRVAVASKRRETRFLSMSGNTFLLWDGAPSVCARIRGRSRVNRGRPIPQEEGIA